MWDKHRDAVEKAEAALEDKGGDLGSGALLASRGGVVTLATRYWYW